MHPKKAIVLVIDGWGANFLGPYGNTWIETPAMNRLAAESLLFENTIADSADLAEIYHSYWHGIHACQRTSSPATGSLAEMLAAGGVRSTLVTDDTAVARHPDADGFANSIFVESGISGAAIDLEHSQLAQLCASSLEHFDAASVPSCLWIHAKGLTGPWDAPHAWRQAFAQEDDPDPPAFTEPPSRQLPEDVDPDELLGITHAYAAQVVLADHCVEAILDQLPDDYLFLFTSPRGFPLGEHGALGYGVDMLYSEVVQTPLLVRFPDGARATQRRHGFAQPPDLFNALLDWFEIPRTELPDVPSIFDEQARLRDRACAKMGQAWMMRTPAWLAQQREGRQIELFAKPDDRWDANEIATRCNQAVRELAEQYDAFCKTPAGPSTPLSDLLLHGLQ